MKVLIIDDNQSLIASLKTHLEKKYQIESCNSGQEALRETGSTQYDLIVLDLSLPDIDGEVICQKLRNKGVATPILILTADEKIASKVKLLDLGADDYLLKPFKIGELQARIRALIRRAPASRGFHNLLEVGDLIFDIQRRRVERNGVDISLRRKELDILEYLMRNQGKVVTRTMILENVWEHGSERWNNTVDVHIKYLRDKIDRPFEYRLIKTIYGLGYMIDDSRGT